MGVMSQSGVSVRERRKESVCNVNRNNHRSQRHLLLGFRCLEVLKAIHVMVQLDES